MQNNLEKLELYVNNRTSLEEVSNFLKNLKAQGISQNEVESFLTDLRKKSTTENEDWILEILDVVVGFCNEKYRVW